MFLYLLIAFPLPTIFLSVALLIGYFILKNIDSADNLKLNNNSRLIRRRSALKEASIYLAPYNDIWSNLKLSNKNCTLRLRDYGNHIIARDSRNPDRSFSIVNSGNYSYDDLWDMFCIGFNYNTTFDELVEMCERFNAKIKLSVNCNQVAETKREEGSKYPDINTEKENIKTLPKELLDVNNASEIELTALPGVSIVMAKKLIKRREEIGGFKTVKDVCSFLNLKPHMQTQLEQLICVKKMKGSVQIKRYSERSVDL